MIKPRKDTFVLTVAETNYHAMQTKKNEFRQKFVSSFELGKPAHKGKDIRTKASSFGICCVFPPGIEPATILAARPHNRVSMCEKARVASPPDESWGKNYGEINSVRGFVSSFELGKPAPKGKDISSLRLSFGIVLVFFDVI